MPEMPFHRSYQRSWLAAFDRIDDPTLYGLYHLLCMHIYERHGRLEYNPRMLKTLLRCGQVKTVEKTIARLVELGLISISQDNMLHNRKAAKEIAKFDERSAKVQRKFAQSSAKTEPENAMNSTRAHDRAHSPDPYPEYRDISTGEGNSSAAARDPWDTALQRALRRYRNEEIGHEPESGDEK